MKRLAWSLLWAASVLPPACCHSAECKTATTPVAKKARPTETKITITGKEKKKMDIREEFRRLQEQWATHCLKVSMSSTMADYLDHPAYRGLVALGPQAVPLIMERYEKDDLTPWEFVLQEITGVRLIEDPNDFSPPEVKQRRIAWWQKQRQQPAVAPKAK